MENQLERGGSVKWEMVVYANRLVVGSGKEWRRLLGIEDSVLGFRAW